MRHSDGSLSGPETLVRYLMRIRLIIEGRLGLGRSFIHFNRRDVKLRFPSDPNDPWYSEFQCPSDGFDRPRYHVTRAVHGPASQVEPGDTIWLVGQLYTPWGEGLPATLDARIDVADIGLPKKGGRLPIHRREFIPLVPTREAN